MAIDYTHPEYEDHCETWQVVRDTLAGTTKVKEARDSYLPRLSQQGEDEYLSYIERALYVNYTKRAHKAWCGMMFRKPMVIDAPTIPEPLLEDADMLGNPIREYFRQVGQELTSVGRCITLIDWNEEEARPFLKMFKAEELINWRWKRVDGRMEVTLLVFKEMVDNGDGDSFTQEPVPQWRVLRLEGEGESRMVTSEEFRKGNSGTFVKVAGSVMSRRGKPIQKIPVVIHNSMHDLPQVSDSPLEDIARTNISHYQSSADLENGRHLCGIPTPCAAGFTSDGQQVLTLGASSAWVTTETDAKSWYLEFSGSGLSTLERALDEKEKQMAVLGARAITPEQGGAESTETVKTRATAETSALQSISKALETQATTVLKWLGWWNGTEEKVAEIEAWTVANRDFVSLKLSAQELTAIINAYLTGGISFDTLFHNLREGEIYPEDAELETERAALEEQGVASLA